MTNNTMNDIQAANTAREEHGITSAETLIAKRRQGLGDIAAMSLDVTVNNVKKDYIELIAEVIEAETEFYANKRGRKPDWFKHLSYVPALVSASHAFNGCWDGIGAQWTRMQVVNCIAATLNDEILANVLASDAEGLKLLKFINKRIEAKNDSPKRLSKRAIAYAAQAKKKVLRDRYGRPVIDEDNNNVFVDDENRYRWSEWDSSVIDKVSTHLINCVMKATGLFNFEERKQDSFKKHKMSYIVLTEKGEQVLLDATKCQAISAPRHGPMLVEPNPWNKDSAGPYRSFALRNSVKFVKNTSPSQEKAIEDAMNDGSLEEVFEAVNSLQSVPYTLNRYVSCAVHWVKVRNLGSRFKKYPDMELPPETSRLSKEEYDKLEDDEKKDRREDILESKQMRSESRANLCNLNTHLSEAIMLRKLDRMHGADKFYMPHQLDYRGRVYHVNAFGHQHSDYLRAMFLFANKVEVTKNNAQYFDLQLANTYGKDVDDKSPNARKLDKKPFDERQAWAARHEEEILLLGKDFRNPAVLDFWSTADEPFQFLAACREWYLYKTAAERGEAYFTGLPIGIDATNSALQIYAAMGRNVEDGNEVNLVDADVPSDIYTTVMEQSRQIIDKDISTWSAMDLSPSDTDTDEEAEEKRNLSDKLDYAKSWKALGITRSLVKPNAMTWSYSATTYGFAKQIQKELKDYFKSERANKDSVWRNKSYRRKASFYLATVNMIAVERVVKSGKAGMEFLQKVSNTMADQNHQFQYKTPLGFPVVHSYYEPQDTYKRNRMYYWDYEANDGEGGMKPTNSTRIQYSDSVDKRGAASGVAPNFVHSLDATILMKAVLNCKDIGISDMMVVHDSFSTTLDNVFEMREMISKAFVTTFEDYCPYQDVLEQNFARLTDTPDEIPTVPDRGLLDIQEVYKSKYFCS